jgi:hypothetical protein
MSEPPKKTFIKKDRMKIRSFLFVSLKFLMLPFAQLHVPSFRLANPSWLFHSSLITCPSKPKQQKNCHNHRLQMHWDC